jgi:ABC-type sugar transport system ATPase subunit
MQPLIEVSNGSKRFGHVNALVDVHLQAFEGEILALLGDNGAGKSTLVKALCGVYELDEGTLKINGKAIKNPEPRLVRDLGVSTVFQDLAVVETLDVAANMFLGEPLTRFKVFANRKKMIAESARALQELKIQLPSVRVPIGELSGGQRQSVVIARAVRQDNPVIIMDEPTAALGVRETSEVRNIILQLRDQGKAIILVSHNIEFVFSVADRVQVMRLGQVQGIRKISETTHEEIVGLITGAIEPDRSTNSKKDSL